ncbi:hypothetical protein SASPL_111334 [Salvia splendens]|uniref:Peptidoglycan binding-like domain-containing protein n=1 Tax=Salvia splendens TaxID=180675 RepID=A0A8X9A521_SALSN|nr:hypothetical protein SASPL_111334 [Salvia splendens]
MYPKFSKYFIRWSKSLAVEARLDWKGDGDGDGDGGKLGKGNNTGFESEKSPRVNTIQLFDSEFHLRRYGYYEYAQLNLETGASEDQILELAIKMYQGNFGIKPTGVLDDQTLSSMMAPRCGNPDIDSGLNSMNPRNRSM